MHSTSSKPKIAKPPLFQLQGLKQLGLFPNTKAYRNFFWENANHSEKGAFYNTCSHSIVYVVPFKQLYVPSQHTYIHIILIALYRILRTAIESLLLTVHELCTHNFHSFSLI